MIRSRSIEYLRQEYGAPEAGNGYERWVIHSPQRITSLHVVVNSPLKPDRAHVLIFDPALFNGDAAIDVQVSNSSEIAALLSRIKRIATCAPASPG